MYNKFAEAERNDIASMRCGRILLPRWQMCRGMGLSIEYTYVIVAFMLVVLLKVEFKFQMRPGE